MRRYYGPMTRTRRLLCLVSIALAMFAGVFVLMDARLRPVVKRIAEAQAIGYCNVIIGDAVTQAMVRLDTDYTQLVTVREGTPGVLTANIAAINSLKAQLTSAVQQQMDEYAESSIEVRLGTLLGTDFLADRGPTVQLRIIPVSSVGSSITNEFASGGINQTLHRIMMQLVVDISIVLPGYSTTTTVVSEFCIAETIIVGTVPESYYEYYEDMPGT
ncbi:MAG: sporulation protein YunB [Clostridia bacterium]|nr:sporulation protein YunB [Clostridia bacterium]